MSDQQPQTPNPLLVKLEVLKKALKDERKQKSELEAEVIKLKEEGEVSYISVCGFFFFFKH